jgi:flagellar biosynthetic protein FliO
MKLRTMIRKENIRAGVSKLLLFIATAIICLWMVSGVKAASLQINEIKSLPSSTGETVEISLTGEISENQILAEFQRNFLQLSIRGASAFPAKNATVNGQLIDKVFVYQYQPDLTRARILFKQDASSIQKQVHWEVKGAKIFVRLDNNSDVKIVASKLPTSIKTKTAQKIQTDKLSQISSGAEKAAANDKLVQEDERLISAILNDSTKELVPAKNPAPVSASTTEAQNKSPENESVESLFSGQPTMNKTPAKASANKPVNPITRMLTGLITVLSIIALLAYGFKRFVLQGRVSLGRQDRMVDMVSSYMLSPKKQIAVVRVGKQYMVLGVTDANINLIQNLGEDANIEKFIDDSPVHTRSNSKTLGFDSILQKQVASSDSAEPTTSEFIPESKPSLRSLIKQRIEGFKPL